MCALIGSFLAKIYGLTNMVKKPYFGSMSHFFFPNLDIIYSLMVQAATVLYLLAKNSGVVLCIKVVMCSMLASYAAKYVAS